MKQQLIKSEVQERPETERINQILTAPESVSTANKNAFSGMEVIDISPADIGHFTPSSTPGYVIAKELEKFR